MTLRREDLPTPALVLDLDALDANIAAMVARAGTVPLRPHAKTHKSADIAKRQRAAGAIGHCCAKIGEAEALAGEGLDNLLITSPVVNRDAMRRLIGLNRRSAGLMVVIDHPDNARALAETLGGDQLSVVIDIDPGIHRTGVASPQAAVELAEVIAALPQLVWRGVQFYCGAQQHIEALAERQAAIADRSAYLRQVIAALSDAGFVPEIVTGSGTGTHALDLGERLFTELQVGSYVFMDRQYERCPLDGGVPPFANSLFVDATVISANTHGLMTVDAGFKALSSDGDTPRCVTPGLEGASFAFMGDEHGALFGYERTPALGERVTLVPPHCDPTVNLYDAYHVVRGDEVIAVWPVSARGRSG